MEQDWLADVRRYDADASEAVVDKIVKHCGIALRTRDASLVSFSDSAETDRVRESFLKKKLARTDDDATLDAAIASVGETMKGDNFKNRVTVYYLLAKHFGQLDVFGGAAGAAATTAATTATAATAASSTAAPAAETPPMRFSSGAPASKDDHDRGALGGPMTSNDLAVGAFGGFVVLATILIGVFAAAVVESTILPEPTPEPVAVAAPSPPPEPAIPEGAGVTATERDGRPMLTVYFDTGSSEVTSDFEAVSSELRAYLDANPGATVAISGFNDPTGNAEINAALSRDRAMGVQAALVGLGLEETRTDLVRPDDTTTTDMTNAEARRVEITIIE